MSLTDARPGVARTTYNVFAYYNGDDDGLRDERREHVPGWKLAAWLERRGFDHVVLDRTDGPPSSTLLVTHHVCSDPHCPGGCQ